MGDPFQRTWTSRDALLYSLGVGAGYPDATADLPFTTENSRDITQRVLPTYGVALALEAGSVIRSIGKFNPAMLVHAEQGIQLPTELPTEGSVVITTTLTDIIDKRSGALVRTESRAVYEESGDEAFTTTSGVFIRGEGGFGGDSEASGGIAPDVPEGEPDHQVTYTTLPHQALLYRLSGDRNPLHSDPSFAGMAGFPRPILHGLCTYGFTGRALLASLCTDPDSRLTSMTGRFTKPVLPGQDLHVSIWVDEHGGGAAFRTTTDSGAVALDRGRCTFA